MSYQFPFKQHKVTNVFGIIGSWSAGWHIGTDLVGIGDITVYPIAEGIVESVNAHGKDYGNHLTIKHADGNVSLYAHLANLNVTKGQAVTLETKLGQMGATGRAFGAHLHLELHKGRWQYPPKGSKPSSAPWIIDPISFIEANLAKPEEEVIEVRTAKQWELDLIEQVCKAKGMDTTLWRGKAMDQVTVADLFMILAKM